MYNIYKCKVLFVAASVVMNFGLIGNLHGSNPLRDLSILRQANSDKQHQMRQEKLRTIIQNSKKTLVDMRNSRVRDIENYTYQVEMDSDTAEKLKCLKIEYEHLKRLRLYFNSANESFEKYAKENGFLLSEWKEVVFIYLIFSAPYTKKINDIFVELIQEPIKSKIIIDTFPDIKNMMEIINNIQTAFSKFDTANDSSIELINFRL